jgi:hypothetical protein
MKQTVHINDFHDAFHACGRGNQFSYEGRNALFEFLEQYESDMGEEMELDVIALCCEYAESSVEEIISSFDIYVPEDADDEEKAATVRQYLDMNTFIVGEVGDGFIYQQF